MSRDLGISSFHCPTKLIFGIGAHERLVDVIREQAAKRWLVLLDPALANSAVHRKLADILAHSDVATSVFSAIETEPSDSTVQAAFAASQEHGARGLLAIGESCTIDVAKAVGVLMTKGGRIADHEGSEKCSVPPPLIAVPTIGGAGSAVSAACAIADAGGARTIRHAAWPLFQLAILDPLTVSAMPAQDAAYAGMDAFVHAFESYLSKQATVFSDAMNVQAMTLLAGGIRAFVADRGNAPAALDMLCGSTLAAMSSAVTGLGNVQCMAMSLRALLPVPQGLAKAVCLPHAAAFNAPSNPERYARVAAILGMDGGGRTEAQGGAQAVHGLRALCSDLGIPSRLRELGVAEDRLEDMARWSFAADYNRWNPRYTSEQDFRALFRAAF